MTIPRYETGGSVTLYVTWYADEKQTQPLSPTNVRIGYKPPASTNLPEIVKVYGVDADVVRGTNSLGQPEFTIIIPVQYEGEYTYKWRAPDIGGVISGSFIAYNPSGLTA